MKDIVVIIPIYNGEKYIKRCIDCILNQTFKNVKIVCVNDGSKDNSLNILNSYQNENIFIVNKENGGVSSARNAGIDFAFKIFNDFYISFIDCDDFVDANYFETLVNMLEMNGVDIVCSSYFYEFENKSKKYNQIKEDAKFSAFESLKILLKDDTVQSHSHCKLYKKEVWEKVRFPEDIAWMEDQATIFKTFDNSSNGVFISNYAGYHYWQEGVSACRSSVSNKKVIQSIKGYIVPFEFEFKSLNKCEQNEIKNIALSSLANVYLMMYSRFDKRIVSESEKEEFKKIKMFVKRNKVVKKYKAVSKKEKFKKYIYLYLRPFYSFLYRMFSN
ncbi:MAG: glycosyltransferase [Bacilli bacterium]|nr:glycosyltransferase [Bacilli bacterium]